MYFSLPTTPFTSTLVLSNSYNFNWEFAALKRGAISLDLCDCLGRGRGVCVRVAGRRHAGGLPHRHPHAEQVPGSVTVPGLFALLEPEP
jgi:hypothetical protein